MNDDLLGSAWGAGYEDYEKGIDNSEYWLDIFGEIGYDEYLNGRAAARNDYEAIEE